MKFTRVAAFVGLAACAYAETPYCGSKCNPSKKPNGELRAKIDLVAQQDLKMGYGYQVGGEIVIKDDCTFTTENFFLYPQANDAFWTCNLNGKEQGVGLTDQGTVNAVNPTTPQNFDYDVSKRNGYEFCPVALLTDCYDFKLFDKDYQLIATAKAVNNNASGSGSSSGSSSSGKGKSSGSKTSDATTSKWGMGLLGLTSLAAYLLA